MASARNYSIWRRLWHRAERAATAGRWPARVAARIGTPLTVAIEQHEIRVAESLGSRDRLRIAFASDFHAGANTPDRLIASAVEWLAGADVDLVLLGGDFVSLRLEQLAGLARRLSEVPARLGKFAVLGNHDHWTGGEEVAMCLETAGITMLTNRNVRLADPFRNVSVCGLDDHTTGNPDASAAFKGAGPIRVVLMHAPSNLLDVAGHRFAVAICGHTHGGQIALPNGRPLKVAHGPLSRRYNAGRFAVGDGRIMLVSRGIGYSTVPIRANAPPSVMICTLYGADTEEGELPRHS